MTRTIKHILLLMMVFPTILIGQEDYQMIPNKKQVDINFLANYYEQDGNNSPVTGGIGTEELSDVVGLIVVNIPLDSSRSINISAGADNYTSASTDNINNNRSSASRQDTRVYGNLAYSQKFLNSGWTLGGRIGASSEYDYQSINGGINISKQFNEGNSEVAFTGQAFFDNWDLIYPVELRREVRLDRSDRQSYNGQLTYSQVINQRMQVSLSTEAIYMTGLLSTPFHRVFFSDQTQGDIERLPESRLKLPFALRLNYTPFDQLFIRTYYRYYTDDWGIDAHTASIELPVRITPAITVGPFYRYHTQTASDYFAPYAESLSTASYYTSDYDLSDMNTSKYGLGISVAPLYGLFRANVPATKKGFMMKEIQLRGSRFTRTTEGFNAWSVSLDLAFAIQ